MKDWPLTPVPPAAELPKAVPLPSFQYKTPEYIEPLWEPIIIYREDVPGLVAPKTSENKEPAAQKKKITKKKGTVEAQDSTIGDSKLTIPDATPPEIKAPKSEFKEVENIEIPILGIEVPVPKTEIVVTAATTATIASVASVGGTLAATAIFQRLIQISKPLITFGLKKLAKARGKQEPLSWARKRAAQRRSRHRKTGFQA